MTYRLRIQLGASLGRGEGERETHGSKGKKHGSNFREESRRTSIRVVSLGSRSGSRSWPVAFPQGQLENYTWDHLGLGFAGCHQLREF